MLPRTRSLKRWAADRLPDEFSNPSRHDCHDITIKDYVTTTVCTAPYMFHFELDLMKQRRYFCWNINTEANCGTFLYAFRGSPGKLMLLQHMNRIEMATFNRVLIIVANVTVHVPT